MGAWDATEFHRRRPWRRFKPSHEHRATPIRLHPPCPQSRISRKSKECRVIDVYISSVETCGVSDRQTTLSREPSYGLPIDLLKSHARGHECENDSDNDCEENGKDARSHTRRSGVFLSTFWPAKSSFAAFRLENELTDSTAPVCRRAPRSVRMPDASSTPPTRNGAP